MCWICSLGSIYVVWKAYPPLPSRFLLSPLSSVAVFRQLIIPMPLQRLSQNECETLFFYYTEYLPLYPRGARTWRKGDPSMSNNIPLNLGHRKPTTRPSLFTISFQPLTLSQGPTPPYTRLQPAEIAIEQFAFTWGNPRLLPLSLPRPSKGYLPAGEKAFSGYLS